MIPTTRLLVTLALILLPCSLVASIYPALVFPAGAISAAALAAAVADAIWSRRRLRHVGVHLPERVRLTKGRLSNFDVEISRPGSAPSSVRLGLVIASSIGAQEDVQTALADGAERFRLSWQALPSARGLFPVTEAVMETSSHAGLWSIRKLEAVRSEIRVYPNLLADKGTAASVMLNRAATGTHNQRQLGKGREFEKLRDYAHGDTYEDIYWRATARRGRPVTKVFQVERTQEVYAVIDSSRLTGRVIGGEPVLERFLTAALLLALAVQKEGDLFGLIAFDDGVRRMVRAGSGHSHFGACRDEIYTLKPNRVSAGFGELSHFLRSRLRKRALLLVLTDLDDAVAAEEFEHSIRLVRRQHLVLAHMVRPASATRLFSAPDVQSSDDVFDRLGGHLRWHKLQETQRRLQAQGVPLAILEADTFSAGLISRYRNAKARQLL